MKFYIKIGELYVRDICVSDEAIKTDFIYSIDLKNKKDYCLKICEEEQELYRDKLSKVLGIEDSGNPYDIIIFEEGDDEDE